MTYAIRTMPARRTSSRAKAKTPSIPTEIVHYYRLVFQVEPGGSRKAEFFVAGTLPEIQEAAQQDLGSGDGAYHALFYGETIILQCWEGNTKVASIDLHPFLTYRIEGIPRPIKFKKTGDEPALDMGDPDNEELMLAMTDESIDIDVKIDWDRIKLPTLQGRPLRNTEQAPFDHPAHPWPYGFISDWDSPIRNP